MGHTDRIHPVMDAVKEPALHPTPNPIAVEPQAA